MGALCSKMLQNNNDSEERSHYIEDCMFEEDKSGTHVGLSSLSRQSRGSLSYGMNYRLQLSKGLGVRRYSNEIDVLVDILNQKESDFGLKLHQQMYRQYNKYNNIDHQVSKKRATSKDIQSHLRSINCLQQESMLQLSTVEGISTLISKESGQVLKLELCDVSMCCEIPVVLSCLPNLRVLVMSKANLFGVIPPCIYELFCLEQLCLSDNQLHGLISDSISKLFNLEILDLSMNVLSGQLPRYMGSCRKLKRIKLAFNYLSGAIPISITTLPDLIEIDLTGNQLLEEIPSSFVKNTKLEILSLGQNRLTGCIPESLFLMKSLRVLSLTQNHLHGHIPSSISNAIHIEDLRLEKNRLIGSIPSGLCNCTKLVVLKLSDNQFSGEIPMDIGNLIELKELWLYNNKLSGKLPDSLTKLVNLHVIGLNNNEFSGSLPTNFSKLWNISYLDASSNQLSGELPNLYHLPQLDYLKVDIDPMERFHLSGTEVTHIITHRGWGSYRRLKNSLWERRKYFFLFVIGCSLTTSKNCLTHVSTMHLQRSIIEQVFGQRELCLWIASFL